MTKKEKALLGISIVSAGAAGYLLCKYNVDTSKLEDDIINLKDRVRILEEVVSEEVLDEAIATTTRKLNYRTDKIKVYEKRTDPKSIEKLKEHIQFKNLFEKRLKDFNELKRLRYIEQ